MAAWQLSSRDMALALIALGSVSAGVYAGAQPAEQVIKITAKRFDYTPAEVTVRKGVPVVLELTSTDILMGFNAPELGVRTDLMPGQTIRVRIVPPKTGRFTFFCDIFCGSGHEEMNGIIRVVDA
ncbi:MAG: cupredoxin domain-containing protein [Gammaproteobacteria bacterium]